VEGWDGISSDASATSFADLREKSNRGGLCKKNQGLKEWAHTEPAERERDGERKS